ncbi:MAG: hypothetical protein JRH15_22010 [Deltaproteobacteria bacterium]|nr:hypothetical protein [Deltaproteobacteria bacterium]
MFPGVNIRVAGIDVSKIVGAPHAGPHVHDTPEIYFAPSEEKGVALVEIQMDEEVFTVESPFAIFVPPGVKHCFKVLKCDAPHFIYGLLITDQAGWPIKVHRQANLRPVRQSVRSALTSAPQTPSIDTGRWQSDRCKCGC